MKARLGFPWKCFLPHIFHFRHEQFQIYLLNEQYCECLLCANTEIDSEGIKERETKITSSNNKKSQKIVGKSKQIVTQLYKNYI